METKVAIYRVIDSRFPDEQHPSLVLHPYDEVVIPNQNVMDYLWDTNPDMASRYYLQSSRWRSPRLNRISKTASFRAWSVKNSYTKKTVLYGYASCEHDGRLSRSMVKVALLDAVQFSKEEVRIYPSSNKYKPSEGRMVYVTRLHLELV